VITVTPDATRPLPYKLTRSNYCLLDKTDLVFVTLWEPDSASRR